MNIWRGSKRQIMEDSKDLVIQTLPNELSPPHLREWLELFGHHPHFGF